MTAIAKIAKNRKMYECKKCDYITCNKYDFDKHNKTNKHLLTDLAMSNGDLAINLSQKSQENNFVCQFCNKKYKDNSGLWKHKSKGICIKTSGELVEQKSNGKLENNDDISPQLIQLITELVKGQNGLQESILELCKNGTNNTINTHTNSHNKAFNLNLFLNETCKDAMNIMDFVESIKLQVSDLESVGELGYVEGISNIIVKNLNALDVTQRPVHCTDKKRETIYIKDDNKWEKDEERKMMHKMIKKVADKNARLLPKFTEKYPDYKNYHSKNSDKYSKIIVESMGGSGDNDYEKEEKIIKNIAKNIVVEK
jgi:hypothetical protein